MTFFEPGAVRLAKDLLTQSANGIELYARMGDLMGTAN
jgi:phosphatidylserine decarboxylase